MDLYNSVVIDQIRNQSFIDVYPDGTLKPEIGNKLNKGATVTLNNIALKDIEKKKRALIK